MNVYRYTAVTAGGQRDVGVVEGPDERSALAELERRRLTPVSLTLDRRGARGNASSRGGMRVRPATLGAAYVQVAELLEAGVPLLRALRLMGNRKSKPGLARLFTELADEVADGEELAESMARRPRAFKAIHVAVVRAGEKGGFLDSALKQVGAFILGQVEIRAKLIDQMTYPLVLLAFMSIGLAGLFFIFVPQFKDLFVDLDLPLVTRIVFGISALLREYGLWTFIGLIVTLIGLWRLSRIDAVREWWNAVLLQAPLVGPVVRGLGVARFCRVLGTLLENGVGLLPALQISRDAAGYIVLARAIDEAAEAVRAGDPLADPLEASGLFEDDVVEMIRVGESANNLDAVLLRIADTHDQRVDRLLGRMMKLVEPLMIAGLAIAVGIVAISLILPMMQLTNSV